VRFRWAGGGEQKKEVKEDEDGQSSELRPAKPRPTAARASVSRQEMSPARWGRKRKKRKKGYGTEKDPHIPSLNWGSFEGHGEAIAGGRRTTN